MPRAFRSRIHLNVINARSRVHRIRTSVAKPKLILLTIAPIFPTPPSHQMMHPMKERLTASLTSVAIGHRLLSGSFACIAILATDENSAVGGSIGSSVFLSRQRHAREFALWAPARARGNWQRSKPCSHRPSKHKRSCSSKLHLDSEDVRVRPFLNLFRL